MKTKKKKIILNNKFIIGRRNNYLDLAKFFRKRTYIYLVILFACCSILYLPSALNRDLHYRDELRYVEVAREMSVTGNYLVPHFGGEVYPDKPPVYFWLLNFSKKIFGNYSTLAMIFPSLIAALSMIIMTFYLGKLFWEQQTGLLAALILATNILFFVFAVMVRMDLIMSVLIGGSLIFFYVAYQQKKTNYYLLVYFLMALAITVKGPAGFLMPLVIIPTFLFWERNLAELKNMKLKTGLLIFFGILLLWLIPAFLVGGKDYAYQLLIVQTFGRAANSFIHTEPFYYYFVTFPVAFLPWSLLFIAALLYLCFKKKELSTALKFILSWFLAPLILFSFFSSKLLFYLLPIYPAAALLTAYLFKELKNKSEIRYFVIVPVILTIFGLLITFNLLPANYAGYNLNILLKPILIALIISIPILIIILKKKKIVYISSLLIGLALTFILNFSLVIIPAASSEYTKVPLAEKLINLEKSFGQHNIIAYRYGQPESLAVYTDFMIKDLGSESNLIEYLSQRKKAIILVDQDDWQDLNLTEIENNELSGQFKTIYYSNDYKLIAYYLP